MLPAPVIFAKSKSFQRNPIVPRCNALDVLLNRARPTNLVILFLLSVCCMSLLFSAFHIHSTTRSHHFNITNCTSTGLSATITRDDSIRGLRHLIIVPGHAIWKGGDPQLRLEEDQWILEPFQKSTGSVATFFAHIQRGCVYSTLLARCQRFSYFLLGLS
jgi:hypothetical protein